MRVLVVTGRWDLVGGSERYAGEVVRGLTERGLAVRVLCSGGEQESGAEVHVSPALDAPRLSAAARRELRKASAGCDVTLLLSWISNAALEVLLAGPPLVRFVQDHTLFCPGLNKLLADGQPCERALGLACLEHYWLRDGCSGLKNQGLPSLRRPLRSLSRALGEVALLRGARRVLVASEYMASEVRRAGLAPETIEVLPYFTRSNTPALLTEELDADTENFWSAPDTFKLFTPSRLVMPDKGIDYLLTALGKLPSSVKLVLAGDGPARVWLERKAADEGLSERVQFTGWGSPEQVEAHYAACDLVVFPSIWNEPFGLVGLEAMAHGKPVVACDVGGVRQWMLPGETGLLVKPRDAAALAEGVAALQAHPARGRTMGERGRELVASHFRPDAHLDRLLEILR